MVETFWVLIGLIIIDFFIALIIRKLGLEKPLAVISVICFALPMMYSMWEWNIGIQNGTYTITDVPERIQGIMLFGLMFAFTGGMIGFFVGNLGNSNDS